ncbi:DinB family protein [Arthrobacter mobilis]|uniref:DinB family protein n=1 Tax=Arthrobacter mobilis TaxID=2724944 RepID=A0A7X6HF74_9MICC|nr:DinB family protein [Arthrobacter mobilis]NKX54891.1 DinB family protein [Arthrobacter mobilis]
MAIIPDTKDWMWVTGRSCPDCGFDPAGVTPATVGPALRAAVPRWHQVLARPQVRERPDDSTWSPLEYASHVRDVCTLFRSRLEQMLTQEDPGFANWDADAAAVDGRYGEQDPAEVARQLEAAATATASAFEAVTPEQWQRPGRRSNGTPFTVTTLGSYFLHEVVHHMYDVGA